MKPDNIIIVILALVDFDHLFDSPFILPPKAKKSKACARQSGKETLFLKIQ